MVAIVSESINSVQSLIEEVTILSSFTKGQAIIYQAQINSGDVFLIVVTGVGKANTALSLGLALMEYDVDNIIASGSCGSLKLCSTSLGSIAISKSSIQFDVDYSKLGYPKTLIPELSEFEYEANESLVLLAKNSAISSGCDEFIAKYSSGDHFVASARTSYILKCRYGVAAVDSSSGTCGQIAMLNRIPYVCVKGVSNFADFNAPSMYEEYKSMASKKANKVVYTMLKSLT